MGFFLNFRRYFKVRDFWGRGEYDKNQKLLQSTCGNIKSLVLTPQRLNKVGFKLPGSNYSLTAEVFISFKLYF